MFLLRRLREFGRFERNKNIGKLERLRGWMKKLRILKYAEINKF